MNQTQQPPIGVILSNLGTPDAPTTGAIRRFLRAFLWDPRVIEVARPLWWCILQVILLIRPRKIAPAYQSIWTEQGSPLMVISGQQAAALASELGSGYQVELAMRYGQPDLASALHRLQRAGCKKLIVLPLYPQYSATTTASTFDAVSGILGDFRDLPELRFIRSYSDDSAYIDALAHSIETYWQKNGRSNKLLFSFHGIPQRYVDAGDPYANECQQTATALAAKLGLSTGDWQLCYQSRVGREPWLMPYTDFWLRDEAKSVKTVDVVCPGFAADCLETLEEIAIENRDLWLNSGGEDYRYIPALNDQPDHIKALAGLVRAG